jgi:dCMP deaminase
MAVRQSHQDWWKPMRPSKDVYFLRMAQLVATRATCARRQVGCVLVSGRGHVLATGYNGVAAGRPHCNEGHPCEGANLPSGTGLDLCQAAHAEQNALLQCHDVHEIETCYCTTAPCVTCTKLLLNTSCRRVVFVADYPHTQAAMQLWHGYQHEVRCGREWIRLDPSEPTSVDQDPK